MITQESIDNVMDLDIESVISKFVALKKKGANWTGCCPFHDEKTPSFSVSPSKGIYKCFGCGAGGNAIKFVMEKERLSYPEAIKWLGKEFNIVIEETKDTEEDKEVREKRATMADMNADAAKRYRACLMAQIEEHWVTETVFNHRRITQESAIEFQLGYAPDRWDFLSKRIVDAGLFGYGEELGLIRRSEQRVYDFFRDRIIFPIHNERGEVVGFTGRKNEDGNKENPKYINSPGSLIYKKDAILYGLYQAQKEIRKRGFAILVEGNVDVVMMHQGGARNTVAPCGTAFTETQAQKLLRYTSNLVIMYDGDDAGRKATLKTIDIAIMAGFEHVKVVTLDQGEDPDTLVQFLTAPIKEKKTKNAGTKESDI